MVGNSLIEKPLLKHFKHDRTYGLHSALLWLANMLLGDTHFELASIAISVPNGLTLPESAGHMFTRSNRARLCRLIDIQ